MNFNTGATAVTKDAVGPVLGVPAVPGAQPLSIGAKTPLKKPAVAVGQKKPGEAMPPASQPASKKQKTQGTEADQSIDALNDVTAVSGVNLREEEEQLLAGPKEESRTTEAMRKFVQEEEERLFLERGPLRAKTQAIAAKAGLRNVSEDVERCLSMAAEERLRSMLYKLIKYSKQRCDVEKEAHNTYVNNDPRRQVLLMKRKAKEAMEKKQADENERLRKLNEKKDKGALTDGDNDDLQRRAQKAQQEEDDKMRAKAANVAARNAVGATDMLSKWQMMAAQGLAKRQGGDTASDSARAGTADETAGSREQERRQENGEAGKASGSGRMDADGDGPSGPAAAGRPPGSNFLPLII
jgi:transcription initiation factor TFIID subunit 4